MEIGMIGLGKMGMGMAKRLQREGHRVVGFARSAGTRARAQEQGIEPAESMEALAHVLQRPRVIWMMLPAGDAVDQTLAVLSSLLSQGDTIIDGGNSSYKDTQRRGMLLSEKEIDYIDSGTSGGVWGPEHGYSLMIGGDERATNRLRALFAALAPSPDKGWGRVGPIGAGHFIKMIHNGIEYGLMQTYGEGFALLKHKKEFALDLHQIAQIWRDGSVVRSWLLDLTAAALAKDPQLEGIAPYVADSGEGRWTVIEAIDLDVAAPVITLALLQRLRSRDADSFSDKLLAAMRQQFGGHDIRYE